MLIQEVRFGRYNSTNNMFKIRWVVPKLITFACFLKKSYLAHKTLTYNKV